MERDKLRPNNNGTCQWISLNEVSVIRNKTSNQSGRLALLRYIDRYPHIHNNEHSLYHDGYGPQWTALNIKGLLFCFVFFFFVLFLGNKVANVQTNEK